MLLLLRRQQTSGLRLEYGACYLILSVSKPKPYKEKIDTALKVLCKQVKLD